MYKHTINFQIGDKFTVKDLRSISYKKYSRQIEWVIWMTENHSCCCSWSLNSIIRDFNDYVKTLGTIDVKNDIVCEVCKVEEDYNYLRVYLQCVHPDIINYLNNLPEPEPSSGGSGAHKHAYYDHLDESWYRDREHWSEVHGFESW